MRVWNEPIRSRANTLRIITRSCSVKSQSSSCPSAMRSRISAARSWSSNSMVGSSTRRESVRATASDASASMTIADASEAVARTLSLRVEDPTIELLDHDLAALIRERIADGQLDDCDLTLHDLVIIRSVFARLLIGSFHTRITYPQALIQ